MNNGKAQIENSFGNYSIILPSKKNWFIIIFGTAWMGGWYFGFESALSSLDFDRNGGINGFLTFWLVGWTVGGLSVVFMLLWGLFGKEKLEFDRQVMKFEKTIFGIGIKKRLLTEEIENFRFEKVNESIFGGNQWAIWGLGPGKVKFDYGFKTYSFALAVDDEEANYLADELNIRVEK